MSQLKQYIETLKKHDDPVNWEYPIGFDYEKEQKSFFEAKNRLQSVLRKKLEFETGSYIQDASYHSAILLDEDCMKNTNYSSLLQIRFSNFGNMVAFLNEDELEESTKIDIIQHLTNIGYTYIPEEVLLEQYTGKNQGVSGIYNWWVRYFDFV